MKNILKLLNIIILGAFVLVSCNMNDHPVFDDKNAFIAFDKASYTVAEDKGEQEVFVTLASVAGISTTVIYELVDGTAKKDINYKLVGDGKLTFTNEARTQSFKVTIIDNPEFTGDLNFGIRFSDTGTVSKGEADSCIISISDLDHPLNPILGNYTGAATTSQGSQSFNISIGKDATALNKVWISNLDPYFAGFGYSAPDNNYFFGTVTLNEEETALDLTKKEIVLPAGQAMNYAKAELTGLNDPDPDKGTRGSNIVITFSDDAKTLTITNAWGIWEDGWWHLVPGGLVLTKK